MNSVGMNTKITMYPKTVHFVREYQYCSFPEWDEEIQKNIRWQIGREWINLKANGRTRKFKSTWTTTEPKPTSTRRSRRNLNIFALTGGRMEPIVCSRYGPG